MQVKGGPWAVTPALVAPQWQSMWRNPLLAITANPGASVREFDYANRLLPAATGATIGKGVIAQIGPVIDFTSNWLQYTTPVKTISALTVGCLMTSASAVGNRLLTHNDDLSPRIIIGRDLSNKPQVNIGAWITTTSFAFTIDDPYFYLVTTAYDGNLTFTVKNLSTGAFFEETVSTTTTNKVLEPIAEVGGATAIARDWDGKLGMLFSFEGFLPAPARRQWADDPFGPFRMVDDVVLFLPAAAGTISDFRFPHRHFG